ncbi:MAG: hypothetical protein FWF83_01315 [Clostridiales bacterium]|nr:hypothetical protein [Clostridiales bacterium]
MVTYVICEADGTIHSVSRQTNLPDEETMETMLPEGGYVIDLTGQEEFEEMDILEIHEHFMASATKKRLVKRRKKAAAKEAPSSQQS